MSPSITVLDAWMLSNKLLEHAVCSVFKLSMSNAENFANER